MSPPPNDATAPIGPLHGLRVIEFAGLGPGPVAGMLLADMGADVIVIERAGPALPGLPRMATTRGKRSIALDLKSDAGRDAAWRLLASADALIEGFRPGVMERLGFGPDAVAARNAKLVYGRVTGWGQTGPLAQAAGHDINYVALTGISTLAARPGQVPALPATIVGDMAGGAMFLVFGIACALLETQRSGRGQVIDAAMVDGVATLGALVQQMRHVGYWQDAPSRNFFLHASPFYDSFECADGKHVSFGAIEPAFYAELLQRLGLTDVDASRQYEHSEWPALRERIATLVKTLSRDEWCARLEGSDACFAPVLDFDEAAAHPHLRARGTYVEVNGQRQPAPAPRLSRTPAHAPRPGAECGQHTDALLTEIGYPADVVRAMRERGDCA